MRCRGVVETLMRNMLKIKKTTKKHRTKYTIALSIYPVKTKEFVRQICQQLWRTRYSAAGQADPRSRQVGGVRNCRCERCASAKPSRGQETQENLVGTSLTFDDSDCRFFSGL
ncbi:Hypothetical protein, putative [Bodo saltans]|uniref:Uncharacterized protein n=1 Tax=Bodo saltans TaxID=75058 RepID=A0A0S4J6V0_BODSA|nr:Hypothetical protein, putative [Bodo saltans]|eukprot:CUG74282.1 Hypothetical protein, putative [Bodo saltans]